MNRGLYSAAAGMTIAEKTMEVISHNLANASTTAFKRDVLVFNEGFDRELGAKSEGQIGLGKMGAGPSPKGQFTMWETGNLSPTGNSLDFAIGQKEGAFAIQTESGIRYTRNGAFTTNETGELVTKDGYPVLDAQESPLVIPPGKIEVARDGTISSEGRRVGQIGVFGGDFKKVGSGFYDDGGTAVLLSPAETEVQQGFLESSNVNAIEEMVAMIRLNRAFEMAQKSAQSQDESTQRLLQSLSGQ